MVCLPKGFISHCQGRPNPGPCYVHRIRQRGTGNTILWHLSGCTCVCSLVSHLQDAKTLIWYANVSLQSISYLSYRWCYLSWPFFWSVTVILRTSNHTILAQYWGIKCWLYICNHELMVSSLCPNWTHLSNSEHHWLDEFNLVVVLSLSVIGYRGQTDGIHGILGHLAQQI